MTGVRGVATLRVEPRAIPAVRIAFEEAAAKVGRLLDRLSSDGYLGEPWLGDEVSRAVCDFYNHHVMDSPTGPYAALVAYHAELVKVRDTLLHTEQEYRRVEGDNAELWGRG